MPCRDGVSYNISLSSFKSLSSLELDAAYAPLLREKRDMDDGKPCYPLESKAASATLPTCHHRVHRPLLAVFSRSRLRKVRVESDANGWSAPSHQLPGIKNPTRREPGRGVSTTATGIALPEGGGWPANSRGWYEPEALTTNPHYAKTVVVYCQVMSSGAGWTTNLPLTRSSAVANDLAAAFAWV